MQFIKINTNDMVFNNNSKLKGKVIHINRKTNVAKVEVIVKTEVVDNEELRTTKVIKTNLADLTVTKQAPKINIDKNWMYHMVLKFHQIFGHKVSKVPTPLPLNEGVTRTGWTAEEAVAEFIHVSSANDTEYLAAKKSFLEKLEVAFEDQLSKPYPTNDTDRLVDQSDALGDAIYLILGTYVTMGVKPAKIFESIQKANMSKLDANGNVVLKPDGKIGKSDLFTPPEADIRLEIERQQLAAMNRFDQYEVAE